MLDPTLTPDEYLQRLKTELDRIDQAAVQRWADLIYQAWQNDQFVYLFGNGGSALNATHMAQDFAKSTLREADLHDESLQRLKVLSLTGNVGWIMAVGNDLDYDQIFVQQLMNFGKPGDLCLALSSSGNSVNVLHAVDWANRHGLVTFGLTGFDGGKLKRMQQDGLHIEIDDTGMVESIQLSLFHWVLGNVYGRINLNV